MSLRKVDMNELSDALEGWFLAYSIDTPKSDPQTLIMDGTQDERVVTCAARIVESAGGSVYWP